tara:strand:- start:8876 stop:9751 length:876 start_codon:yes stop_codon:yes gene_type:complete
MGNFFTNTHKVILLFSLLVFGCFNSESSSEDKILLAKSQDAVLDSIFQNYDSSIEDLNKNISNIYQKIQNNTTLINSMNDSMRVFQQIDISGNTSDKDIINSLIRIQSKLNLIEEKIFYSDSLYFNLLTDLVLIESQIEDLSQNINNITDLSIEIDKNNSQSNIDKIEDYKQTYDLAVEYYMNKKYEKSLDIFNQLIAFDTNDNLADNAQFWVAQIFYIQKKYKLAIAEYKKVSLMGDKNKAPDAEYKIALSYFSLDMIDEAMNQFDTIIINYPDNIDLVQKSKKYIERYR